MNPTIYKPSIYKGAGIYNTRANGGGGSDETVIIGGKEYEVITADSLKWITSNLDMMFPGIPFNTSFVTTKSCFYYNYGYAPARLNAGLLYNWEAVDYIANNNMLPDGWRIPTRSDFENLISFVGGSSVAGKELKIEDFGGNNSIKWNCDLVGYLDAGGTAIQFDKRALFWTSSGLNASKSWSLMFEKEYDSVGFSPDYTETCASLRLCKDA